MNAVIDIDVFMQRLKREGLVIAPATLVEENLAAQKLQKLRDSYLKKNALTYKEIADAQLWGNIGKKAVKMAAQNNAKQHELFEVPKGKQKIKKLIIAAVIRIAKQRGQWD